MAISTENLTVGYIIELLLKRRWIIIIPFFFSMVVGSYFAITLPKIYSATTLILIQPQKVPTDYVRSVISTDMNARISTIKQQIMSRTNIEKIIKEFNLFSKPEHKNMFMEDKVENVRKSIAINVTKARRGSDAFSISFNGKDPIKVMNITNTLSSYVIDENIKVREEQVVGTSRFLEDQLNVMKKRLEETEKRLKIYREQYMGSMPEQLQTNLRILDRLQNQLIAKQEGIRDAKNRMSLFKRQISELQKITPENASNILPEAEVESETEEELRLRELKQQLTMLLHRYTDKYPDVIKLKKTIESIEASMPSTSVKKAETTDSPQPEKPKAKDLIAAKIKTLQLTQGAELRNEINTYKQDIIKAKKQIQIYEKRVEETPKREQELLSLKRDYDNIKDTYNSLLARKLESELSVSMEKKQKGEQFRIIDSARLPEKPVKPNMQIILMASIALGLGIGGGIIFLLEYIDSSFKTTEEVESFLDLPVIATVPAISQPKEKIWKRINLIMSIFALMVSFAMFCVLGLLTMKGVDQTINLAKKILHF
ncbi:Protein GumC [Candidatus Magnetomoraceae bacterium gMMP-1]